MIHIFNLQKLGINLFSDIYESLCHFVNLLNTQYSQETKIEQIKNTNYDIVKIGNDNHYFLWNIFIDYNLNSNTLNLINTFSKDRKDYKQSQNVLITKKTVKSKNKIDVILISEEKNLSRLLIDYFSVLDATQQPNNCDLDDFFQMTKEKILIYDNIKLTEAKLKKEVLYLRETILLNKIPFLFYLKTERYNWDEFGEIYEILESEQIHSDIEYGCMLKRNQKELSILSKLKKTKMKKTFFENLGLVDLEKIHSSVIRWILDIENECISNKAKNNLLQNMLLTDKDIGLIEYTINEYDNIDIFIKTTKAVICIENKIKSSQHSNQLNRYKELINNKDEFSNLEQEFIYLTLLEEPSENWINVSYLSIYKILSSIEINKNKDGYILTDYIETLSNLLEITNEFINYPANFPNVFKDGSKRKSQKSNYQLNDKQIYISNNQLETALQKLFLRKVANLLELEKTPEKFYITETHGNAALGITLKVNFNNTKLNLAFDFQKGTFKTFCTHENYWKSNPSQIPDAIKILFDKIKGNPKYNYKRVNKGKSKAQYSVTKRMKQDISTLSIQEFSEIFKQELNLSKQLIENEILRNL